MRRLVHAVVVSVALLAPGTPACAERLITSLSNHRILVTSNFVGEDLVLFGAIEPDQTARRRSGGYDLVVTVSGPRRVIVTRKKERRLGIWVNVEAREFIDAPSFLAVLSNRPIERIAGEATRRKLQLGLANIPLSDSNETASDGTALEDAFHRAVIRINGRHHLYQENTQAVTFLTPTLFRAAMSLPAGAPIGTYAIEVKLFADGELAARATSAFETVKAGLEQVVAEAAHDYPLPYGLATAAMALLTGWLASIVFRRD